MNSQSRNVKQDAEYDVHMENCEEDINDPRLNKMCTNDNNDDDNGIKENVMDVDDNDDEAAKNKKDVVRGEKEKGDEYVGKTEIETASMNIEIEI